MMIYNNQIHKNFKSNYSNEENNLNKTHTLFEFYILSIIHVILDTFDQNLTFTKPSTFLVVHRYRYLI